MAHSYRPDLDGVRALAVLLVVLHHLGVVPGGFIGVDVFFTLSGYLITQTLPATTLSTFYLRRVFRLFPALFATLLFTLAAFPSPDVAQSALCAALSVSNLYFYSHVSYFDTDALSKPLLHTWSLSIEEQFYLVYPFLYRSLPRPLLPPALLLLLCLSFARAHFLLPSNSSAAFYLPHLRAWQFLLGALLALLHPSPLLHTRLPALIPPNLPVLVALALILCPAFFYTPETPFPALAALPPAFATLLLLLFGHRSSLAATTLAAPAPAFLGRISYSVYLVHWPLIVAIPSLHTLPLPPKLLLALLILLPAYALYRLVENAYRIRGPRPATPLPHPFKPLTLLALFFLLATVIATGGHLVWTTSATDSRADPQDWVDGIMRGARLAAIPNDSRRLTPAIPEQHDLLAKQVGPIDAPGAPHVLVLGDSHAGRLLPFAAYLGTKYRVVWHVSSYPGCSPLFGVSKSRVSVGVGQGRVSDEQLAFCETLAERWRQWSTGGNFSMVFLVSRWSTSVEAGEYFSRGPLAEYRLSEAGAGTGRVMASLNESRGVFERALRRTVQEVAGSGSTVVIVAEVPDIGRGSYQCKRWLQRQGHGKKGRGGQPGVCTGATRRLAMSRLAFTNRVIREVASEVEGVESLVPCDYFCDNYQQDMRHCRVIWKRRMLYRDSDHLSDYGSLYLALRWEADRSAFFPRAWKLA